jgi:O-antigen/teichoic acid export membrane protein
MSSLRLARGGALGLVAVALERGAALATLVVLGRVLEPQAFGRWAFIVAYLSLFQVVADLGVEAVLLRRLVQAPAQRDRVLAAALALRLALGLAAGVVAVLFAPVAGTPGPDARLVVAIAGLALLFAAQPGLRALLRAEVRMGAVVAVAATSGGLSLVLVSVAALAGAGVAAIFAAAAAAQAIGFALAALLARGQARLRLAFDGALWRDLLRESWPIAANVLVAIVGLRVGAMLLLHARGAVEVGVFTSAFRLAESLSLLADGAMLSVFPLLSGLAHGRPAALADLSRFVAKWLAIGLLAGIVVVTAAAPDILSRLFRPEFAAAAPSLVVLSWAALLFGLGTLYTGLVVAVGRQQVLFRLNLVAMVVQLALQAILVPRLGMLGAATAALAGSAVSHVALAFLPATRDLVRPCLAGAARPVAFAALLCAGLGFAPASDVARAAIAAAAFPALLVATGVAGRGDLETLRRLGALRAHRAAIREGGDSGGVA